VQLIKSQEYLVLIMKYNESQFNELVSIIVPIYKSEYFICQCIDSLLIQTHKNIEIILVDDGSPDNCPAICDNYKSIDNRVNVIHQPNNGVSSARNAGLRTALGDYICWVDSDDTVHPDYVKLQLEALRGMKADMAVCGFVYVTQMPDGNHFKEPLPFPKTGIVDEQELITISSQHPYKVYSASCCKLMSRELYNNIYYPEGHVHEDLFLLTYLAARCKRIAVIPDTLYYYTRNPNSIINSTYYPNKKSSNRDSNILDSLYAYKDRIVFYQKNKKYALLPISYRCYFDRFSYARSTLDFSISENKKSWREYRKWFRKQWYYVLSKTNTSTRLLYILAFISPILYNYSHKIKALFKKFKS
jgi:glycosyltransferase involved in cell wall biosynthesis